MKLTKSLVYFLSLLFLLSLSSFAQDEEMTEDEWQAEMTRLTAKKQSLESEIQTLTADIENLTTVRNGLQDPEDCIDELYALVGATRKDVDNFRNAVNELDGKIKRKEGPKPD
ncbi:MAG: peptidoglycan-binding protein LysM, partial [Ignavibacteriaceae bacterium]|nr:peptidoglycan-binding protein LysM [Ignavibacteriaceae bacterium]